MSSSGLVAQPLRSTGSFNWIYLIDWIVIGVLSLFFLFYFNRLLATVISYLIRLYSWKVFKVYIDIEALQFSPLAGRIFFRGVRYHGDCETIHIHSGILTWRYWLPRTKHARLFQADDSTSKHKSHRRQVEDEDGDHDFGLGGLPCRISVKVTGVEAFIYNRTPAYDYVIDIIQKRDESNASVHAHADATFLAEKTESKDIKHVDTGASSSSGTAAAEDDRTATRGASLGKGGKQYSRPSTGSMSSDAGQTHRAKTNKPPSILRFLPVHVECEKAAAVLGNDNTPAIITANIESAFGEFDASKSSSLDVFKILMGFEVTHPYIQMKPNVDYKEPQLFEATELKRQHAQNDLGMTDPNANDVPRFAKLFKLPAWISQSLDSVAIKSGPAGSQVALPFTQLETYGHERWHGLARYLGDTEYSEHAEWSDIEYAKQSVIADLKKVGFQFYWDIAGPVPGHVDPADLPLHDVDHCDINGSSPPEYGMKLVVHGGSAVYGPWADRNRLIFQQIFFPPQFADSVPCRPLAIGQSRLCTVFKLALTIEEETVVRIPFREPSKDASWKGRAAALTRQTSGHENRRKHRSRRRSTNRRHKPGTTTATDVRPFAWFDIKVQAKTTIRYKQDMFPRRVGYGNDLDVAVSAVDIYSSLNHALLWRSQQVGVKADLSYPLPWNGLRDWTFWLDINRVDFFLLRDHTFLLMDLINDWSQGPLPDFYSFVPFRYLLKVHFQDFKLYLNTNDANIINNAEDLDDNEFVILFGKTLDADLTISLDRFRPAESPIVFDVNSTQLGFELCMPPRNTLSELLSNKHVASLESVELHGSYIGCTEFVAGLTDTLLFEIIGTGLEVEFYGFFGRQLAKIKENYFGETVHFRTLEEYQELVRNDFRGADKDQPVLEGNDLDVILDITAKDANILLPAGLYDADEYVKLHVDNADVDLRVNNYYLELMVNSDPIELSYTARSISGNSRETWRYIRSGTQLFIDGLKVGGHRLFGLPPLEPAYVSNWDIDAGSITGECQPEFFAKLIGVVQSLALGLADNENAVPLPHYAPVHDSTFVRFFCPELKIWCPIDGLAYLLRIKQVGGNFNDCASRRFSQRLNLNVPELLVGCFDATSASRHIDEVTAAKTFAHIKTALKVTMVKRNAHFETDRQLQQSFFMENDTRRGSRAAFLYPVPHDMRHDDRISLPLPLLPTPISAGTSGDPETNEQDKNVDTHPMDNVTAARSHYPPADHALRLEVPEAHLSRRHTRRISDLGPRGSAVPLSSTFKMPQTKLDDLQPDLKSVPRLSRSLRSATPSLDEGYQGLEFDDGLDEDTVHTTVIIKVDPGVTAFCDADAVRSIAHLVQTLQPHDTVQMLDSLQFRSILEVVGLGSRAQGNSSITDISLSLSQLHGRFMNSFVVDSNATKEHRSDRYDVELINVSLSARVKAMSGQGNENDALALHTTLGRLKIIAQEGSDIQPTEGAAIDAEIGDVLLWMHISDHTSINASFRQAEAALASRKVDYLASLIHRTTMMADEFQVLFARINAERCLQQQYVSFVLTKHMESIPDPQFLTRPVYAIRSSPEHVRNSDTWKIISRWRYTLRRMPIESKIDVEREFQNVAASLPVDAESYVLSSLDAWRSWDALRVRESIVIRIVYGSSGDVEKMHDRSKSPIDISVRASMIRAIVDRGKKESAFSLEQLGIAVSISPDNPTPAFQLFQDYSDARANTIQIKTSRIHLRVDWNICELIDRIITLFEASAKIATDAPVVQQRSASSVAALETFHIVFSSDIASVEINTINVVQELELTSIKTSVTGSGWQQNSDGFTVSTIVTAAALALSLSGHGRSLIQLEVITPSLMVAYEDRKQPGVSSESIKVAGDSKEVSLRIKDEALGLIEIADSVIGDEVSYINGLVAKHSVEQVTTSRQPEPEQKRSAIQVDIALFLNIYTVEIALLAGLCYTTTGRTIRISISPGSGSPDTYSVDFDLKNQTHRLLTMTPEITKSISQFEMPAINGHVELQLRGHDVDVQAVVSMEKITLEGTAVYGVFSVVGEKSTTEGIEAIQADALAVKGQIERMFPSTARSKKPTSADVKGNIHFDARGTLAGLAISADAPSVTQSDASANLLFDVSSVKAWASSHSEHTEAPLPFPRFRVSIEELSMELRQMEDRQLRLAGRMALSVRLNCEVAPRSATSFTRKIDLSITGPGVDLGMSTAPVLVDVLSHMQTRMKSLDFSSQKRVLRRVRQIRHDVPTTATPKMSEAQDDVEDAGIYTSFAFDLDAMRVSYITQDSNFRQESREPHDLVLSLEKIHLATRSQAEARLNMTNLQLALKKSSDPSSDRPSTSALMPEVVFSVQHKASKTERKLAFQAAGKALDIQMDPQFVLPASDVERSLTMSSKRLRVALQDLNMAPRSTSTGTGTGTAMDAKKLLGDRNLSSLLVEADFAGAIVTLRAPGHRDSGRRGTLAPLRSQHGRYGQFSSEEGASAILRAPGIALKVQYTDPEDADPKLNVELRVNASKNELDPSVVPLILQMSDAIKKVVRDDDDGDSEGESHDLERPQSESSKATAAPFDPEQTLVKADPKAILGKTQLNMGFRICKQEFSLSCQPIAKVAASAKLDDIYITINNVDSKVKNDHFFAAAINIKGLNATLQHVYSRTITFSFDIESVMLSVMNSKHISGTNGVSAILKIAPTKTQLNAKQMQDMLLFREIWFPMEIRNAKRAAAVSRSDEPQDYFMARYQQIAASTAFGWNATVSISELTFDLDLGQSIGKVSSKISRLWINSIKSSTSRQNLCIGIDEVDISSSGRLSGFVDLDQFKIRTSIAWPDEEQVNNAPLIQGSVGFDRLCVKVAFDYQAFAVADVTSFELILYNVREPRQKGADRLVAILDGEKVNLFCVASSAALSLSLYQAVDRLIQEKKTAYEQSLRDTERFLRRKSMAVPIPAASDITATLAANAGNGSATSISLHTDVVVTLRSLDIGALPSTLLDQQILRVEASDVQARFAVVYEEGKIHCGLGMTLGQVGVALASNPHRVMPKTLGEITIDEVTANARAARGGVILRVPRVVAAMQTWQQPDSNLIEYIFRSSFEGKIDVGWNYSRISFIRGMYATHTRTLAARLGKPLPEPAVKIKGAPEAPSEDMDAGANGGPQPVHNTDVSGRGSDKSATAAVLGAASSAAKQGKITAEVALPESRYTYRALEPAIIETPQLRDMGEATPPLEWVGLQRDKLPNVTHQVIIVALLEVAREVEDAYGKILGRA